MKKVFLLLVLVFVCGLVSASNLNFGVRVDLSDDFENPLSFSLDSYSVDNVVFDDSVGENKLIFESVYENGTISETKEVGFDFYLQGSVLMSYATTAFTSFDFNDDLRFVKVYNDNEEVLSVDLSDLCNNNEVCDERESYLNCKDCKINAEDGICMSAEEGLRYWEDGLCDPDCVGDDDCHVLGSPVEDLKQNKNILIAIILVVLSIIGYLLWKKKSFIKFSFR